jgi:phycocyanobilin lyase subunit beta
MPNSLTKDQLLQNVDAADSAQKLLEAIEDLAAARLVETVPNLIAALGYNNPGAAVAAVDGLIGIGEPAVLPLLELMDGYNYGARAWGVRALAGIGDPRALDRLLEGVTDFALSVRRAAACGLGRINWSLLPEPEVASSQERARHALIITLQDDHEWIVRYAAIVGLQALASDAIAGNIDIALGIVREFDRWIDIEANPEVIARVWLAQKEIQGQALELLGSKTGTEDPDLAHWNIDWQATMAKMYARKQQEAPLPEGDPRRFIEMIQQ